MVDDYAHHPTEVAATIAAARGAYPGRRLVVAFQPHLYSRTRDFAEGFAEALANAMPCSFTALYPSRERPIDGVSSALIADPMTAAGRAPPGRGRAATPPRRWRPCVRWRRGADDGAGDITQTGPELLALLAAGPA
ncbi:MAG: hypothetical protein IPF47_21385 [Gemmatimonadetes bacterium]|nr:hypothetical protein [Gemmatimonadota bacterium]